MGTVGSGPPRASGGGADRHRQRELLARKAALRVAAFGLLDRGMYPIPVNPRTKAPLVPWGALSESDPPIRPGREAWRQDPELGAKLHVGEGRPYASLIFEWVDEYAPNGPMGWAILTEPSHLLALDVDKQYGGLPSLRALTGRHQLPRTRTHRTPSGGLHLVYRSKVLVPSKKSPWDGIEVKSRRSTLTSPPTPGYELLAGYPKRPVDAPTWLVERLRSGGQDRVVVPKVLVPLDTPEAAAILADASRRIREATGGDRHRRVYVAPFHAFLQLGDDDRVEAALVADAKATLPRSRWPEVERTIRDARAKARERHQQTAGPGGAL